VRRLAALEHSQWEGGSRRQREKPEMTAEAVPVTAQPASALSRMCDVSHRHSFVCDR
jgi:hypothetical protein